MKTALLTGLFLIIFQWSCPGQISIQFSDWDFMSVIYNQATDTIPPSGLTPGGAGANQTWNFGDIDNNGQNTFTFESPVGTVCEDEFPQANMAMTVPDLDMVLYMHGDNNAIENLGFCGTIFPPDVSTMVYSPAMKQLVFPITYNSSFNGTSRGVMLIPFSQPPIDSIKLISAITYEYVIDAWGTLITPAGNFEALRQKTTQTQTDSTYMHMNGSWSLSPGPIQTTTTIRYDWLGKNSAYLASVDTDENGNVTTITWLTNVPSGIGDYLLHTTDIYPNPTDGIIAINAGTEDISEIEICNLTGQRLMHYAGPKAGENRTLDLSGLSSGMYFMILRQGQFAVSKKIVIK